MAFCPLVVLMVPVLVILPMLSTPKFESSEPLNIPYPLLLMVPEFVMLFILPPPPTNMAALLDDLFSIVPLLFIFKSFVVNAYMPELLLEFSVNTILPLFSISKSPL